MLGKMRSLSSNKYWMWVFSLSSVAILQGIAISQDRSLTASDRPALSMTESFEFLRSAMPDAHKGLYSLSIIGSDEIRKLEYNPADYLKDSDSAWEPDSDEAMEAELESVLKTVSAEEPLEKDEEETVIVELPSLPSSGPVHVVKPGENLSTIANLYNMTVSTLILYNGLANPEDIQPGYKLHIDFEHRIDHLVKANDSLWTISRQYGIPVNTIMEANKLASQEVKPGQKLKICITDLSEANVQKVLSSKSFKTGRFVWPVKGKITDAVGWRIHPITGRRDFHKGLDIAAPRGTRITAADGGKVVFSGVLRGYGKLVIVDHGNGISSRYAHCSKVDVQRGQRVSQGQKIAEIGSTGSATGPHLHFEIRKMGKPVNPKEYL